MTEPGWYQAEGDPAGTTRYWDGASWIGEPVPTPPNPAVAAGYPSAQGGYEYSAQSPVGTHGRMLAGPGARIGARVIDIIVLSIIAIAILFPVIGDVFNDLEALGPSPTNDEVERVITDAAEDSFGLLAIVGVVSVVWDFIWVALLGATPGKLMLGLRVARADNGKTPPGIGKAALRSLNRLIALVPAFGGLIVLLVGLISLVMLFADDQSRTVMDRIASTVVIKK